MHIGLLHIVVEILVLVTAVLMRFDDGAVAVICRRSRTRIGIVNRPDVLPRVRINVDVDASVVLSAAAR
jgi:hypothetical protein